MALNREQKRMMKKQGDLGDDGAPPPPRKRTGTGGPPGGGRPRRQAGTPSAKGTPGAKEERTGLRQFIKEVRAELRKVAWPTRKETMNYSIIVLVTLVILTLLIFALDWVFSEAVLRLFDVK